MLVLDQFVTVWQKSGNTGYGESFGVGIVVPAKYAERHKVVKDKFGNDILSTHRVYTASDIPVGSYVYLGSYGGDLSTKPNSALQVIAKNSNPSLTDLFFYEC